MHWQGPPSQAWANWAVKVATVATPPAIPKAVNATAISLRMTNPSPKHPNLLLGSSMVRSAIRRVIGGTGPAYRWLAFPARRRRPAVSKA